MVIDGRKLTSIENMRLAIRNSSNVTCQIARGRTGSAPLMILLVIRNAFTIKSPSVGPR